MGAVVVRDLGNLGRLHFLVARRGHLERATEVGPQLEAVHAARRVALGHLLVDDAAARRHPLDVAGRDGAVVAHAVAVLDGSGQDIGDGFDPAMWMPRKSRQVILRHIVAKIVEQEKRVEVGGIAEAEGSPQMHTSALESRFRKCEPFDRSNRQEIPSGKS